MRNGSNAQLTPEAIATKLPEARALLREARLDITARMSLADAALAASISPDELLANLEDRARRAARPARRAEAPRAKDPETPQRKVEERAREFMLI